MKRNGILGLAAGAALLATGAANASDVHWSIGINLPAIGVISDGPAYFPVPAPSDYPAPLRYAPPTCSEYDIPVYEAPTVVYSAPRPCYSGPVGGWHGGREARWAPRFDHDDRGFGGARDHDGRWTVPARDHDRRATIPEPDHDARSAYPGRDRDVRWVPSVRDERGEQRRYRDGCVAGRREHMTTCRPHHVSRAMRFGSGARGAVEEPA